MVKTCKFTPCLRHRQRPKGILKLWVVLSAISLLLTCFSFNHRRSFMIQMFGSVQVFWCPHCPPCLTKPPHQWCNDDNLRPDWEETPGLKLKLILQSDQLAAVVGNLIFHLRKCFRSLQAPLKSLEPSVHEKPILCILSTASHQRLALDRDQLFASVSLIFVATAAIHLFMLPEQEYCAAQYLSCAAEEVLPVLLVAGLPVSSAAAELAYQLRACQRLLATRMSFNFDWYSWRLASQMQPRKQPLFIGSFDVA